MALDLVAEQRLEKVGLIKFFDQQKGDWQKVAQEAYNHVLRTYPSGSTIRQDDVAKNLFPAIEVSQTLQTQLDKERLTQAYWKKYFTALIIDRAWHAIIEGAQP